MGNKIERRRSGGLRPRHTLSVVVVAVVGVLIAFWALSFIAGALWALVKVVIIVAVLAALIGALVRRRS